MLNDIVIKVCVDCRLHVGVSGNVLINEDADRLNSYNIWDYGEGHDSYYASMLIDLTLPYDEVSDFSLFNFQNCYTGT